MNELATYSYYLWKRRVDAFGVQVLHVDDLPPTGFASVYAIDSATANALTSSQDITGFKGIVWSEKLWIDCDTQEASDVVERGLVALGLGFEKYTTGNRGAHFGVNRETNPSQLLPLLDKAWVKARFPQADLKLYSHLHLFRREGMKHEKTGLKKELVLTVAGSSIVFGDTRTSLHGSPVESVGTSVLSSVFDDEFVMSWSTPQTNGLRNKALSNVAYRLAERGETKAFTMRWLQHVNALFEDPKDIEELEKIVRYAYQGRDNE